ncbi:MAG TPA: hypothetical protein VNA16_09685, partial [Abditibacteriaceae bacterium]|nr:hypothetical protein [Abditibacteriaceae bacterium]
FLIFVGIRPPVSSPSWLPMFLFFIVSVTSVLALRDAAVKERNELLLTLVCGIAVVAMWVWMAVGVYPAPQQVPSQQAPSGNTAEAEGSPASPAPGRITPVSAALASVAIALVAAGVAAVIFAFFFGHGYLWWKIPMQLGQEPQQALEAMKASLSESGQALPKMLKYWGGQQKTPRLPGRHDYYIVLMALYELPIVLAALGGIVHAGRRRSLFTDLLLWWAFTSFTLYALANEKVPWLLTHIMLPLTLLAGWWLAHLYFAMAGKRRAFAVCCGLGAIFLLRGVSAVNFERGGDHHEPLLYAQTTEAFRGAFFDAMQKTDTSSGPIWVHNERQWPSAWYLRQGAPYLNNSPAQYGSVPGAGDLRFGMAPPLEWAKEPRVVGWSTTTTDFYIWPRASWPALRPAVFANFWLTRTATVANGVLAPPGEWSNAPVVIGVPPSAPASMRPR